MFKPIQANTVMHNKWIYSRIGSVWWNFLFFRVLVGYWSTEKASIVKWLAPRGLSRERRASRKAQRPSLLPNPARHTRWPLSRVQPIALENVVDVTSVMAHWCLDLVTVLWPLFPLPSASPLYYFARRCTLDCSIAKDRTRKQVSVQNKCQGVH